MFGFTFSREVSLTCRKVQWKRVKERPGFLFRWFVVSIDILLCEFWNFAYSYVSDLLLWLQVSTALNVCDLRAFGLLLPTLFSLNLNTLFSCTFNDSVFIVDYRLTIDVLKSLEVCNIEIFETEKSRNGELLLPETMPGLPRVFFKYTCEE